MGAFPIRFASLCVILCLAMLHRHFALFLPFALFLVLTLGCGKEEASQLEANTIVTQDVAVVSYAPVRPFPEKFPRRSCMPDMRESEASGPISNSVFSAGRDLVYVVDDRVWWESDNDGESDDECDHTMHYAMELPFRRLVEMCVASNATLRVQEAYRATGVHASRSLHKEGRALDLTCPELDPDNPSDRLSSIKSLEILAKMAWAAGFDWVYNEWPRGGGPHIHASIKRPPTPKIYNQPLVERED